MAVRALEYLKRMIGDGEALSEQSIEYVISVVKDGQDEGLEDCSKDVICITNRGKPIKAKTVGQKKYVKTIKDNTVVLGLAETNRGKFEALVECAKYVPGIELSIEGVEDAYKVYSAKLQEYNDMITAPNAEVEVSISVVASTRASSSSPALIAIFIKKMLGL
jgi:hypothetical protein